MGLSNGQNCCNDQGDVVVVAATAVGNAVAASHHEVAVVGYNNDVVDVDDVVDVGAVVVADVDLEILEALVCHPTTFCLFQNCCCCCCCYGKG